MWKELYNIKSRAKTAKGIKRAIERATGLEVTLEEVERGILDSWIETRENHIIVWID